MKMSNVRRACKVCALVGIILVCHGILPGQAAHAQSLLMGLGDSETPPYKWKKEGKYVGIFVDVVHEIMSRSDVTIALEPYPYNRLLSYLEDGTVDGAVGVFKTPGREQFVRYVDIPIAWTTMQIFVKKGHEFTFEKINDLSGKRIGKVRGISISKEFDQAVQQGTLSVEETTTYEQSIKKLQAERIDVLVAPGLSTQVLLSEMGVAEEIIMLPNPLEPPRPLYVLFSKAASTPKKEALIEKIRQVLTDMEQEKSFEQIMKKYVENPPSGEK